MYSYLKYRYKKTKLYELLQWNIIQLYRISSVYEINY